MNETALLATFELEKFVARLPKVELHCHLTGTIRPATLVELAGRHGITLPDPTPEGVYDPRHQPHAVASLGLLDVVTSCIKDRKDFARVGYEALIDGDASANLKYMEIFFNPSQHATFWTTSYTEMVDGLIDGFRQAEAEVGIRGRLIASINREQSPAVATQLVRDVIDNPREEVVGIGMDANETLGPPEAFAEAYSLAGRHGLHRTAHAGEWAFPRNILTSIDGLDCDRIDHGYHLVEHPDILARATTSGLHFTCCWATSLYHGWAADETNPIVRMWREGLSISLNSDDPQLDNTGLNDTYAAFARAAGAGPDDLKRLAVEPIDHLWIDDTQRRELRARFDREIAAIELSLEGTHR